MWKIIAHRSIIEMNRKKAGASVGPHIIKIYDFIKSCQNSCLLEKLNFITFTWIDKAISVFFGPFLFTIHKIISMDKQKIPIN